MRTYLSAVLLFLCSCLGLSAQSLYRISGRVIDKDGKPVEYAAVVASDSKTKRLKGTTSDADGKFVLEAAAGEYTLEVSLVGYDKYALTLTLDKDIVLENIYLQDDIRMLNSAKVTANRVEYRNTGYEYKISGIAALQKVDLPEILRTAPGLMVTDRVTLYGHEVSNVYVDRRRLRMRGAELIEYLNSFKGENIERIDVVSDPAITSLHSGMSVHITTKKEKGGFASVNARAAGNDSKFLINPGFNLNHRQGKFAVYTSGNYMMMNNDNEKAVISEWKASDRRESEVTVQKSRMPLSVNGTVGASYDISKRDYIAAELSYRDIRRTEDREISTENTGEDGSTVRGSRTNNYQSDAVTPAASVMYVHTFKDASSLTLNSDYLGSFSSQDQFVDGVHDIVENKTNTFAGYAGYSKRFNRGHSIGAGMRLTHVSHEDANGAHSFAYNESAIRPFASYSFNGSRIGASTGMQVHFVDIDGHNYTNFTPNVSISYYLDRKQGHILRANYSLDVTRPSIAALNPNAVFSDRDIIINVGNPDLKPYYTNTYRLRMTVFNKYTLSGGYSQADKAFSAYMYSDDAGNIYQTYANNAVARNAFVALNTNLYLFRRLSLDLNLEYSHSENTVDGRNNSNNSVSYNAMGNLSLPKAFSVSIMAFGNTKKVIAYNATRREPLELNLTLNKNIKNWRLSFAVLDLFDSNRGRDMTIDMGDFTKTVSTRNSSRTFQFGVTYNFRWGKAGSARRVQSQKNDLSNRIGD